MFSPLRSEQELIHPKRKNIYLKRYYTAALAGEQLREEKKNIKKKTIIGIFVHVTSNRAPPKKK